MSPSQLRRTTNDYIEVTQQEFESVSSLIRGRVKLSEVNSVSFLYVIYFTPKLTYLTATNLPKYRLATFKLSVVIIDVIYTGKSHPSRATKPN